MPDAVALVCATHASETMYKRSRAQFRRSADLILCYIATAKARSGVLALTAGHGRADKEMSEKPIQPRDLRVRGRGENVVG